MFLISQTYAADDPNKPASFTVSGLPGGDVKLDATANPDGTVLLHDDLKDVVPGQYSLSAIASNSAGDSAASDALAVTIQAPVQIPAVPVLSTSDK